MAVIFFHLIISIFNVGRLKITGKINISYSLNITVLLLGDCLPQEWIWQYRKWPRCASATFVFTCMMHALMCVIQRNVPTPLCDLSLNSVFPLIPLQDNKAGLLHPCCSLVQQRNKLSLYSTPLVFSPFWDP